MIRAKVYVSLFVAYWFAAIGTFCFLQFLFWQLDAVPWKSEYQLDRNAPIVANQHATNDGT